MTDIGAYFIGVFFGKHKMNPRISPKKTWEGFVGGIVISLVFSLGFALILSVCKHPLVYGILDLEHWYLILALSFIIPLVSTLGDFVFSCAKRHFEIKDFGEVAYVSYHWWNGSCDYEDYQEEDIRIGYADENMCYWSKDCMNNQI
jgi:CDP-diglyceride synthetase